MNPRSLRGRWVALRPPTRDDYEAMWEWRTDADWLHLWNANRRLPPREEFFREAETMLSSTITLLIEGGRQTRPIGFVQAYNYNHQEGWLYFSIFVEERYRSSLYGIDAATVFGEYLFRSFNIHKLYSECYAYNEPAIRNLRKGGFVVEGRLTDHLWYAGRRWDLLILALSRERWERYRDRLHRLLSRADPESWGLSMFPTLTPDGAAAPR